MLSVDTTCFRQSSPLSGSECSSHISLKIFAASRRLFLPARAGRRFYQRWPGKSKPAFLARKDALLEITLQLRVAPFLLTLDQCSSRPRSGAV